MLTKSLISGNSVYLHIPSKLRKKIGWSPGDMFDLVEINGVLMYTIVKREEKNEA